jgi:hypothetical protein
MQQLVDLHSECFQKRRIDPHCESL